MNKLFNVSEQLDGYEHKVTQLNVRISSTT